MKKYFLIFTTFLTIVNASIEDINTKIDTNKKRITKELKNKENLNNQITYLADLINKEESNYKKIVKKLDDINTVLLLNKLKLNKAKTTIKKLKKQSSILQNSKQKIEKDVIDFVIEKYAMSIGIKQANKETLKEIIDKEVYSLVLDNAKQEVMELNIDYLKVNRERRKNIDKISKLSSFIDSQEKKQKEYIKMKKEQSKVLSSLQIKHKAYQNSLQKIIVKQNKLTDLLGNLNILKKKEIKKQRNRERAAKKAALLAKKKAAAAAAKKKAEAERKKLLAAKSTKKTKKVLKQKNIKIVSRDELDEDINIEVRKIGSSTKGVKISKYKGKKTIAPLKSYKITKKFGKYYDKVYKMELFNESVSLKTLKTNAKVFSVFKGQIVYAKKNSGLLENVVIVKHSGNLHTIYSHLDKISPTLKVGKWIRKGYVVGRVNDTLLFQATKNSKYIDPTKLFK
ncbi:MAG: peptidoglycan DD-metalloendopeptidase family protein [Campylobacterota bacterium]|nr:peptidoglycan DD-metalloendopeptidase family protein [Campylobacterota bacterium]